MNRDFTYKGVRFHLNDRRHGNEFTPKYCLVYFNESRGCWHEIGHVSSKKEAMEIAKQDYKIHAGPYAWL